MAKRRFMGLPINHRLPERIRARFLICCTALPVYHLLKTKLNGQNTHAAFCA